MELELKVWYKIRNFEKTRHLWAPVEVL